jgi:hypothetical protein
LTRRPVDRWAGPCSPLDPLSPKLVVAPMVHHSDLAFRLQTRRYGAQLVYTEMLAVASFLRSARHRRHMFQTCPEDRPLIVQVWAGPGRWGLGGGEGGGGGVIGTGG